MSSHARAALLQTRKNTSRTTEAQMYLLDYNHPTELIYERREALMREARDVRFARGLRSARPKDNARSRSGRSGEFVGRMIALWGRTGVPFFRA
jgi:hypothetical protein